MVLSLCGSASREGSGPGVDGFGGLIGEGVGAGELPRVVTHTFGTMGGGDLEECCSEVALLVHNTPSSLTTVEVATRSHG